MAKKTIKHSKTKHSKKRTKKSTKKEPVQEAAAVPVPVPVVVSQPIVEVVTVSPAVGLPVETESLVAATIASITDRVSGLYSELKNLKTELKSLNTLWKKEVKELKKNKKRRRQAGGKKRAPSGFAKPTPISNQLCDFIGKPHGSEMARTEVTKRITKYCQEKNLQKAEDKRTIHADKTLRDLLRLKKGDELTFFNLQKYMKVHYPNKDGKYIHA